MSASRTQWAAGAVVAMTSVVCVAAMAAATTPTEPGGDEGTAPSASEAGGVESTVPVMTAPGGAFDQQFCYTWLEAEQTFAYKSRGSGRARPRGIPKPPHPSSPSCVIRCRLRSPMPSTRSWMAPSSSPRVATPRRWSRPR